MKGVFYNTSGSGVNLHMESVCLRAGYLLCDYLALAGTTDFELFINEKTYEGFPMKQKLTLLANSDKKNEDLQRIIEDFRHITRDYNKSKHRSGPLIGRYKKMEHMLQVLYDKMVKKSLTFLKSTGLSPLAELINRKIFGLYAEADEPEMIDGNTLAASSVMQLMLPDPEEAPELFILTGEFLDTEFLGEFDIYTTDDAQAEMAENMCTHEWLSFPNLNFLNTAELRLVRKQFDIICKDFKKVADEWLKMCYETDNDSQALSFLRAKVVPAAEAIKRSLEDNDIMQHCLKTYIGKMNVQISISFVPVEMIWKYYKHFRAIKETTWEVLENALQTSTKYKKRWPVLICYRSRQDLPDQEKAGLPEEMDMPQPVKKSISVD